MSVNGLGKGYEKLRYTDYWTHINRSVQILACIDEKDNISRTRENLIQAFTTFKTAAEKMCLKICKLR